MADLKDDIDRVEAKLDKIIDFLENFKAQYEEDLEGILTQLDNISTPGSGFSIDEIG